MKKTLLSLSVILAVLQFPYKTLAEENNYSYLSNLSLEELLNMDITVASKNAVSIIKSPGIVTLITEEDISNSGARDLKEVLELVPGIIFNSDVQNAVGFGIRGMWAFEGKVTVIIDGQEINDLLWATPIFGNHYPVNSIKRVEVLRGPGSAIYGGQSELAVINITTKSAKDINGISLKTNLGLIPGDFPDYTHRNISFSLGKSLDDFNFVVHGDFGLGNRSDRTYKDFFGSSYDLTDKSHMNMSFLNIGTSYKDLSLRLIGDWHRQTTQDLFTKIAPQSLDILHDGYFGELKYDWKINDSVTLTPKFNFKQQYPWISTDPAAKKINDSDEAYSGMYYNFLDRRYLGNLTLSSDVLKEWNFIQKINIIAGTEFQHDEAELADKSDKESYFGNNKGQTFIAYNNYVGFLQGLLESEYVNFTAGGRVENHSEYGFAFAPRLALTGNYDRFHSKLLFSKAYRAPSIENINSFNPKFSKNTKLKPENTTVLELEAGYQLTDNMIFSANVFDMTIHDPIIYFFDNGEGYDNFERTGTRGFEAEYKYKDKNWGSANLSYSFYVPNDNKVGKYEVPNRTDMLLGFPNHKVSLSGNLNVTEKFSVSPSFIFIGSRFGYETIKDKGSQIKEYDPTFLLNLNLVYRDLFVKGLNLSLTGFNLLNQTYQFIQPYNGEHAPIPGPSTEISLNIGYDFKLD